jgi:hypothetical protein
VKRKQTWFVLLMCLIAITCKETDTIYEPVNTLTDPAVKPVVIYTFPSANSVGPFDGFSSTITVRFNKLMDLSALRHAIHFISTVGDLLPDTSTLSINQGDVASVTPIRSNMSLPLLWKVGRSYSLRIDATAKDIDGNYLNPSFEMTFTPEPYFRVKSISPTSGSINVSTTTLQIAFNAAVDTSILSRIVISPSVSGLWHYPRNGSGIYDSSQVIFQNGSGFTVGKTYTISIGSNAVDKNGDPLTAGFTSTFTTTPFTVTSTSPSDGTTNWPISSQRISVGFSDSLDISTIPAAFSIHPVIAGVFSNTSNPRTFVFAASNPFLPDTVYTITIDTSIRSKAQAKMSEPLSFSFMTGAENTGASPLFVTSTNPSNGDTTVSPQKIVQISFNTSLDTAGIGNALSVSPPVSGLVSITNASSLLFSPIEPLSFSTTYTVTLASSITSTGGVSLESPYTFSFTTLPFEVTQSIPRNGSTQNSTSTSIVVITDGAMDTSTARTAFSVTPSVTGNFTFSSDLFSMHFNPSIPLQPYTVYAVTVSSTLRSKSGTPMASPYTFSFATGE